MTIIAVLIIYFVLLFAVSRLTRLADNNPYRVRACHIGTSSYLYCYTTKMKTLIPSF